MKIGMEHQCGHIGMRVIPVADFPTSKAYWKARDCSDCWRTKLELEYTKYIVEVRDLPTLKNGTDKEIAHAESLRRFMVSRAMKWLAQYEKDAVGYVRDHLFNGSGLEMDRFEQSIRGIEWFRITRNAEDALNQLRGKFDMVLMLQDCHFYIDLKAAHISEILHNADTYRVRYGYQNRWNY